MAVSAGPDIVENGLVLCLDAGNRRSYSGTGTGWFDLSENSKNLTLDLTGLSYNSLGYFNMSTGGASITSSITTSTECTCVFWMRTTDDRSLFWHHNSGTAFYLGAYSVSNKFYNSSCGTPTFFMDTVSLPNIYDYIRDGLWHMIEFKSVNFSSWAGFDFNKYNIFQFENGSISYMAIYNRNLSAQESAQNFNALRGRFGI